MTLTDFKKAVRTSVDFLYVLGIYPGAQDRHLNAATRMAAMRKAEKRENNQYEELCVPLGHSQSLLTEKQQQQYYRGSSDGQRPQRPPDRTSRYDASSLTPSPPLGQSSLAQSPLDSASGIAESPGSVTSPESVTFDHAAQTSPASSPFPIRKSDSRLCTLRIF